MGRGQAGKGGIERRKTETGRQAGPSVPCPVSPSPHHPQDTLVKAAHYHIQTQISVTKWRGPKESLGPKAKEGKMKEGREGFLPAGEATVPRTTEVLLV